MDNCNHDKGFTFVHTKLGCRRTCRSRCGFSVTEVTVDKTSILDIPWTDRRKKGKHKKK